jgi:ubiquinone/menaquinone biosynthesis C-methylase UbiE
MPYADNFFDTVVLISILEHLQPDELSKAFTEIKRVLKPGGQAVYGVPVERKFMRFMFFIMGYNIRHLHYSTEIDVSKAAGSIFNKIKIFKFRGVPPVFGNIYEIGHFVKP